MRDVPAGLADALSSRYRIERELGAGGMATVYLARDLKHDRDVAIKVLRADVAAAVGVDRFLSEIKTTGHLKHPHILPLFDSGSADAVPFYVMPFIDGESLRARLQRTGRLPIGEVVRILGQVADALAHAHAKGVVHRDVKSDNVLVSDRHVFLADFGIARALAAHPVDSTRTGTGMMVGTPAYMAPEQIAAGPIDHRTDIYAFGALAYELLTGSPPFTGTPQEVITAHLTRSPDPVSHHRPDTPPALAALVMRCLQKSPAERWQRTEDLLAVLESPPSPLRGFGAAGPPLALRGFGAAGSLKRRVTYIAAAVVALLVGVWYAVGALRTPPSLAIGRIAHVTSEPGLELDPAISPDGRTIAYAAGAAGRMRIFVRQIAGGRMVPLMDESFSEGQRWPQWSPDGSRILFQSGRQPSTRAATVGGTLYQAPALGGAPRKLFGSIPGGTVRGMSWAPDGARIAFGGADGLYVASADGDGVPRVVAAGSDAHSPRWSRDGRSIAFVNAGSMFTFGEEMLGNVSTSRVMVVTLDSGRVTQVTSGEWLDTNPVWMPDNRTLLFVSSRGGGRDIYTIRLTSDGRPVHEPERLTSGLNAHGISLSADGTLLAYSTYAPSANIWSIAIPVDGIASVADASQITFGTEKIEKLAVSKDGRWLAYDSDRNGYADIWKQPLTGGPAEQLTRGPNHKFVNDWSPDGREIVFHSIREGGQRDLLVASADGTRTEVVAGSPAEEQHAGWGPDENSIVYDASPPPDGGKVSSANIWDAYIVTRARRGAPWGGPRQLTRNGSSDPKWSPDGRLIAYTVRGQLRVIAPDGTGDRVLVDARAGDQQPEPAYPVWSPDSQTIYYKAYDRDRHSSIWSVPADGGTPRLLVRFDDPSRRSPRREFATDGQRFYFTVARDESDIWTMEILRK